MSRKKRSKKEVPPVEAEVPAAGAGETPEETPPEAGEAVEVAGSVEGADADAVPFSEDPAPSVEPTGESPEEPVEMSVDELLPETPEDETVTADEPSPETGEVPAEEATEAVTEDATDSRHSLKKVIEAILFASQKPVSAKELIAVLKGAAEADKENPSAPTRPFAKLKEPVIQAAIEELEIECADVSRAYEVRETAAGWQLVTKPDYSPWLRQLYPENRPARLSAPALETLAIIAYRQPITRADIEAVRGVAVDGVMQTLLDRGLVKIAGRAEIPGRPLLYDTTQHFMEHFGLKDLDDLPNATELRKIALPKAEVPGETPATPAGENSPAPAVEGESPTAEPHQDFMEEAASEPDASGETAEAAESTEPPAEEAVASVETAPDSADAEEESVVTEEPSEALPEAAAEPSFSDESPSDENEPSDNPEHAGVESEQREP